MFTKHRDGKKEPDWEEVRRCDGGANPTHWAVYRMAVPGGWLYKQSHASMVFVPGVVETTQPEVVDDPSTFTGRERAIAAMEGRLDK